ncbi:diguanylate cyclase (GGDEF) domain-containing protein [Proteiniborus ethanoligenes]|uniref:Diguanylate cyclase (GGDEF) domain-containing protein n=1 Tax=Proteiniborus ethanoligenes TaxID=415015 RepID=A0A1H3LGZ9_9FIRM|nr:diguanylate cyclase [Proteiniborus ethanoligenes]SDY63439.1 diguanylate cyclase (GGDEF) domain-containing protein [Proteiniborus ethanoligenes]
MNKTISDEIYNKLHHAKTIASVNPDKSLEISEEAYDLAKANNLGLEEGYALIGMVFAYRIKSDRSSMLDYSFRALSIFEAREHIAGQVKALNLIGIAYFYSSLYEEALRYFLKLEDMLEFNRDDFLLSGVLNNIGEVYRESGIYDKAMEYYEKAIDIVVKNDFSLYHAAILSNIGQIHCDKGEFEIALKVYCKSYDILVDSNDMVSLGEIENRIGKVYFEIGDIKKAEEYYFRSFERLKDINNKYYVIDVLLNIAQLHLVKASRKTLNFYEKAIEFADDVGAKNKICQIYRLTSEYHESQGDYMNALKYYKNYYSLNEQVMSSNLSNKLEMINIELKNIETIGKFEQIKTRLEKEIAIQKDELEKIKLANEMLEKKAYEDELTGVPNRRSINAYLKKILEEMSSKEEQIVLFMIDIDNFKKYNDYWGHSQGDICLRKITDSTRKIQSNRNDIFGRYGGEEFVYISTPLSYMDALELGNLIRAEVERLGLYYMEKGEHRNVTISVGGVIGNSSDFSSIANIMEIADRELYRAKEMGRNMTILRDMKTLK